MEAGGDENGPKRCKTRRLGHGYVFFYFFRLLCLLTTVYRFYLCYTRMGRHMEAGGDKNGPKRCKTRHFTLGPYTVPDGPIQGTHTV